MAEAPSPTVLALDLGTSSAKALLVGPDGQVLARAARDYPTVSTGPGRAEQDPDQVLAAAAAGVRELTAGGRAPHAVVLSSAMHSVLALGSDGSPITPMLTWADDRGAAEAARLRREGLATDLEARTGTPVHASSPLCKLLWMRGAEPDLFARASAFVSMKEYLLRRWLGRRVVDVSVASSTGLFDLATGTWDAGALGMLGLGPERLSEPVATLHTLRDAWAPAVAEGLGLPAGIPVVVGATDGVLANVGVGAVDPGVVAITMGSSAAARRTTDQCGAPRGSGLFCYILDDRTYVIGGAINNAGLVVDWLARQFFSGEADPAACVFTEAARAPAGSRGLRCIPALTGERFPVYDSALRGSWTGLTLDHGRAELARSALEGVVLALARVVQALVRAGGEPTEVRAGGGMLRAPLVAQMLADALGRPVSLPASPEASAVGAALLARRALGHDTSWSVARALPVELRCEPEPRAAACYREMLVN